MNVIIETPLNRYGVESVDNEKFQLELEDIDAWKTNKKQHIKYSFFNSIIIIKPHFIYLINTNDNKCLIITKRRFV